MLQRRRVLQPAAETADVRVRNGDVVRQVHLVARRCHALREGERLCASCVGGHAANCGAVYLAVGGEVVRGLVGAEGRLRLADVRA